MRTIISIFICALSVSALAASDAESTFVYATYANCNVTGEEAGDKTFEQYFAPAYRASLESGDITGWGFLKHHAGGQWRRLSYHMGSSVTGVIKASDKMGEMLEEKGLTSRNNNYGKACHSHDDYIWELLQGNAGEQRGTVGLSVYMICDMSREDHADELVDKEFAAAYDAQVKEGALTSWGWMSHVVGGEYRRLLTMSAANIDDLVKARTELLGGFAGTAVAREFTSICGSHQDYLWEIAMEGRQAD